MRMNRPAHASVPPVYLYYWDRDVHVASFYTTKKANMSHTKLSWLQIKLATTISTYKQIVWLISPQH